jgi:hypothetical protein
VTEKLDDGRLAVEFSAEAECELLSGDRYRVIDLRAGKARHRRLVVFARMASHLEVVEAAGTKP